MDALIQHYLHADPSSLSDSDYALHWARVKFIREFTNPHHHEQQ